MYQVTIVSAGSEIGYGEGESLASAKSDAMASLDSMGKMYVETFGFELIIITE